MLGVASAIRGQALIRPICYPSAAGYSNPEPQNKADPKVLTQYPPPAGLHNLSSVKLQAVRWRVEAEPIYDSSFVGSLITNWLGVDSDNIESALPVELYRRHISRH
jgi:hypothetical protein